MMKNVFTRALGQRVHATAAIRQLSSGGTIGAVSKKYGGRLMLQSKSRFQVGSPSVLIQRMESGMRGAHDQRTKGDEELIGFLEEEIATEKKMQRTASFPTSLEGFSIAVDKSELLLTKKFGNETINISANVNHSVDAENFEEPQVKKEEGQDEMRSKPNFDVEIVRGNETLCFHCSFVQNVSEGDGQEEFNDVFSIDEVTMYQGEWVEKDYAVAGDILDGYLYDLLMNLLEERGVTNQFVEKFSDLCTDYEHKLYVELLGKFQEFLGRK